MKLSQESGIYGDYTDEQKEFLASLMPLNLKGRYPDDEDIILENISPGEFETILSRTKEFILWIKKYTIN